MHWHLIPNRRFLWKLVCREMRGRYAGSVAGLAWAVAYPAVVVLIFVAVFSGVLAIRVDARGTAMTYAIFLCCGILPWNAVLEAVSRSSTVFVENGNLIKRVLFARETLVAQIVAATTLSLGVSFALLIALIVLVGHPLGPVALLVPAVMALQVLFLYGLGLLAATLSVFFRDLTHAIPLLMQAWFWLSPVVYPESILPGALLRWMRLNPIAWLVHAYRDLLLDARMPDPRELTLFAGLALLLAGLATGAYHRLKGEIADEV